MYHLEVRGRIRPPASSYVVNRTCIKVSQFPPIPDYSCSSTGNLNNPLLKMAKNTTTKKIVLVLGGSYGGISTAHYVLKHVVPQLPDPNSYQVILASSSSQALCRQACPRALISDDMFNQEKLFVSIPKSFERYPEDQFRFIQGTATNSDHNN